MSGCACVGVCAEHICVCVCWKSQRWAWLTRPQAERERKGKVGGEFALSYGLRCSQKALTQVNKPAHTDTHTHTHTHWHSTFICTNSIQYSDFTKGFYRGAEKKNIINRSRIYFSIYALGDNDKFVSSAA